MIDSIESSVLWNGRVAGPTWFHPRACMVPAEPNPVAVMTMQAITGSDVFHHIHWTESRDLGKAWSEPEPVPSLGRHTLPDGVEEGYCDVVPEYHPQTRSVLAMGHSVLYKDGVLYRGKDHQRYPAYVVRSADGEWSHVRRLEWDGPDTSSIYTCGCGQRVTLDNGNVLIPTSHGPVEREDRAVRSLLCSFNGRRVSVMDTGDELRLPVKRGLLEPSMVHFRGRFFMTIRAEDDRGYVSVSDDGLHWEPIVPWRWDDGEPLTMSTTQQHWLAHSDGLFLVYTRKAEHNTNVMRWRAPLYLARVDVESLRLTRDTEMTVLPLIGDGVNDPDHVARMGNFHVTNASPSESWVTVGECLPKEDWKGDVLLARIR